jgi:hypothetical protein
MMNRYCRIIGLCCLLLSTAAGASELCRWTDEDGVVHFDERCPEGIESEVLEFEDTPDVQDHTPPPRQAAEPGSQTRPTPEELREAAEKIAFDPVTSESQLHGCWKRIRPSAEQNPNYNRIEIYPFEEPQYQYFCYEAGGKLYTMMTNRQPDESPRRLKQRITALPSVERYGLAGKGRVWVKHMDAGTEFVWITSLGRVRGDEEVFGLRTGDLYMTLRNPKTGEDVYVRHLRRIE